MNQSVKVYHKTRVNQRIGGYQGSHVSQKGNEYQTTTGDPRNLRVPNMMRFLDLSSPGNLYDYLYHHRQTEKGATDAV